MKNLFVIVSDDQLTGNLASNSSDKGEDTGKDRIFEYSDKKIILLPYGNLQNLGSESPIHSLSGLDKYLPANDEAEIIFLQNAEEYDDSENLDRALLMSLLTELKNVPVRAQKIEEKLEIIEQLEAILNEDTYQFIEHMSLLEETVADNDVAGSIQIIEVINRDSDVNPVLQNFDNKNESIAIENNGENIARNNENRNEQVSDNVIENVDIKEKEEKELDEKSSFTNEALQHNDEIHQNNEINIEPTPKKQQALEGEIEVVIDEQQPLLQNNAPISIVEQTPLTLARILGILQSFLPESLLKDYQPKISAYSNRTGTDNRMVKLPFAVRSLSHDQEVTFIEQFTGLGAGFVKNPSTGDYSVTFHSNQLAQNNKNLPIELNLKTIRDQLTLNANDLSQVNKADLSTVIKNLKYQTFVESDLCGERHRMYQLTSGIEPLDGTQKNQLKELFPEYVLKEKRVGLFRNKVEYYLENKATSYKTEHNKTYFNQPAFGFFSQPKLPPAPQGLTPFVTKYWHDLSSEVQALALKWRDGKLDEKIKTNPKNIECPIAFGAPKVPVKFQETPEIFDLESVLNALDKKAENPLNNSKCAIAEIKNQIIACEEEAYGSLMENNRSHLNLSTNA